MSAPVAWIIEVDHVTGPTLAAMGCRGRSGRRLGPAEVPTPHRWRVKDADGEVHYEGRASEECFEPLDWAQADAGATDIEYLDARTGRWIGL